ncbi:hypothetical protein AtNW77_Chr3g0184161 [Arabidopsis thaliana]
MDEVWFLNFQSFLSNGNGIVFDIWGFTSERINRRVVVGEMHRILLSPAVMALQIQVMVVEENCDGLAVEEENCNGLMSIQGVTVEERRQEVTAEESKQVEVTEAMAEEAAVMLQ